MDFENALKLVKENLDNSENVTTIKDEEFEEQETQY